MISILLATTGRTRMAERCVNTLLDSTEGHELDLVLAIDSDRETVERLLEIDYPPRVKLTVNYEDHYRGCSEAWNDALGVSKGDPVVLAADDLEFQPGWAEAALECLSQHPDGWGMVGFNDGHWGEADFATHYMVSRRFIVECLGGVIAWPFYRHSFNDLEMTARARLAGRFAWCEDARVYHNHWIFGDRPQDHTDSRNLPDHPRSQQIFLERQQMGFPSNYEAVICS